MARYKHYDYGQMKMLPVSFDRQILAGTFEHTLNRLIDEEFDLSVFEARYNNEETGAPAYDQAILLKIVLLAYRHEPFRHRGRSKTGRGFQTGHALALTPSGDRLCTVPVKPPIAGRIGIRGEAA